MRPSSTARGTRGDADGNRSAALVRPGGVRGTKSDLPLSGARQRLHTPFLGTWPGPGISLRNSVAPARIELLPSSGADAERTLGHREEPGFEQAYARKLQHEADQHTREQVQRHGAAPVFRIDLNTVRQTQHYGGGLRDPRSPIQNRKIERALPRDPVHTGQLHGERPDHCNPNARHQACPQPPATEPRRSRSEGGSVASWADPSQSPSSAKRGHIADQRRTTSPRQKKEDPSPPST